MYLALKNVKMTVNTTNYSGTEFCPLRPEIAPSSIGFRLNVKRVIVHIAHRNSCNFYFFFLQRGFTSPYHK